MNDTTKRDSSQVDDDWKCEGVIRNVKKSRNRFLKGTKVKDVDGVPAGKGKNEFLFVSAGMRMHIWNPLTHKAWGSK